MKYNKLIFATLAGSHLYGTNHPESDVDIRGVCLTSLEIILGWGNFEQYQPGKNEALKWSKENFNLESDDVCIYGIEKFMKLAADANPNILELLFAPNLVDNENTKIWNQIVLHRDWFLSTKLIHTFAGYAFSQLKRIKTHRKWLEKTPIQPNPYDYGLLKDFPGKWASEEKKKEYHKLKDEWERFNNWRTTRNPKRYELEQKYGYDTKHAMHLYRLIIEAKTLLEWGELKFPFRGNTLSLLKKVYEGEFSYEDVIYMGESAKDNLMNISTNLSGKPNRKKINDLLIEINFNVVTGMK